MSHVLIRHKVADFAAWKVAYDHHAEPRHNAGFKQLFVLRSLADPNEVFMLFTITDGIKAKAFIDSPDLHATMIKAGVVDKPDVYFLS